MCFTVIYTSTILIYHRLRYVLLFFALIQVCALTAQSTQHFRGRVDDFTDVAISLACQAEKCTGTVTYLRSETTLQLAGTTNDGQYRLRELDHNGAVSGYLTGRQQDERLVLAWTDPTRSRAAEWALQRIQKPRTAPTDCSDDKWWRSYRNADSYLLLQKAGVRTLRGHWYYRGASYTVAGDWTTGDEQLQLTLVDDRGTRAGLLLLPAKIKKAFTVDYLSATGTRFSIELEVAESLAAYCEEYADYQTRYDLLYPVHPEPGFTAYLTQLTDSWLRECRRHATVVAARQTATPERRARERAYAHTDLAYVDDKLLSGLLTFDHSWRQGTNTVAVNYDLQADRALDLYDLVRENHGFEDFRTGQVRRYFRDHELARTDPGFRDWIESNSFAHWTVRPGGLAFHTEFSTLYGRHTLVLSYDQLKPYLRKDAVVRRFY